MPRFTLIENNPEFPSDGKTCWYWDLARPTPHLDGDGLNDYIAVQCYCSNDPNDFVRIPEKDFKVLFTDQAEYYFVCPVCYFAFEEMQWSGSTRQSGYMITAENECKKHAQEKGWCEFCDPIFGSGGWLP